MRTAPQHKLAAAGVLVLLLVAAATVVALTIPVPDIDFGTDDDGRIRLIHRESAGHRGRQGPLAVALVDDRGHRVPLDRDFFVEDPDQLPNWTRLNEFLAINTFAAAALDAGTLSAATADGRLHPLHGKRRGLLALPGMFWLQLLSCATACMLAAGVYAFRPADRAARHFAVAGFSLLLSAAAAAVYSTREFALDGTLFRLLSQLNYLGAFLFAFALLALIWHYPRRLGRFPIEAATLPVVAIGMLGDALHWGSDPANVRQLPVLLLFGLTFAVAFLQWRRTRERPVERAALKWFLLSVYLGTGLFAGLILLPTALGRAPIASQGAMFVTFLVMFGGIALGILRYRLFDLDRWWFRAWSWFLSGAAVLALDLLLVSVLRMSHSSALTLSLAAFGWLYFPLRQWAWSRFVRGRRGGPEALPGTWLKRLFGADNEAALSATWHDLLRYEFAALEQRPVDTAPAQALISDDGQRLRLGGLAPPHGLELAYPDRGRRLFSREDCAHAEQLLAVARRAQEALLERERGAAEERQRVMRDLHDDVGAKLLSLIHLARDSEVEGLARSAIQEMRCVLTALEAQPCSAAEAAAEWQIDARQRSELLGVELEWQTQTLPDALMLSARERANLGRILREGVSNALRHGGARRIRVALNVSGPWLEATVDDDGDARQARPEQWPAGRGTRTVRRRAEELGGDAAWRRSPTGGIRLRARVAIAAAAEVAPPHTGGGPEASDPAP